MFRCKTVDFFYVILPLKIAKDYFLRRHLEKCPSCQAKLATREEAKSLLIQECGVSTAPCLWPEIKARLVSCQKEKEMGKQALGQKRRRWAAAAAALFLMALASYWVWKDFKPDGLPPSGARPARFELEYIRVAGQPANAFIYQPKDSEMIVIWAEKNP